MKSNLKVNFAIMHKWLLQNHITLNPKNCYYMLIGHEDQQDKINLNDTEMSRSNREKLLDWLIHKTLSFDAHIKFLFKK